MSHEWSHLQRSIFEEVKNGSGHLVIQARAGSGKSSTLIECFEYIPPNRAALFVAFNKKIADELQEKAPPNVTVSTLHSFGLQALTQWSPVRVNVNRNKADHYLPKSYKFEERRLILDAVGIAKGNLLRTKVEIDEMIDRFDLNVKHDQRDGFIDRVIDTMRRSEEDLETVDYDDMVWLPVLKRIPVRQYPFVFCDEVQDLSPSQILLALAACKSDGGRVIAVGDSRQMIYGWRGIEENSIEKLVQDLNAKVLPLSITYRCPRKVVELAREIVPDFEAAPWAPLGVVQELEDQDEMLEKVRPGDFVLSRFNAPLLGLCMDLIAQGIPSQMAGRDIASQLVQLIRQAKCHTTEELVGWTENWLSKEMIRLERRNRSTRQVQDRAHCILALSRDHKLVAEVLKTIEKLFSDTDSTKSVVFSSVHRCKGLQRDRVFVLKKTFFTENTTEEKNLWYVAITRSARELYIVG